MTTMAKIPLTVPQHIKRKLESLKTQGFTINGYIRALLERELNAPKKKGV